MSEELRFAKDMPIRLCTLVRIVIECGQLHQSGVTHPFCLTTPVFLFLLVLFYPKVNAFAYRITAFNGLLYGLFNMTLVDGHSASAAVGHITLCVATAKGISKSKGCRIRKSAP
jgi:hypothetical protein